MMTKSEREHLEFLADSLETVAGCTPEQWQQVTGSSKDVSIRHVAAALRRAAQKKSKRTETVPV